jgi:MOSC domain-containing protein YiiM
MTPTESGFSGKIVSIQRGRVVTQGDPGCTSGENRVWTSAFRKTPLQGPVLVTAQGIEGDEIGDRSAHGGVDKAVLLYADRHYKTWQTEYPDLPWCDAGNSTGGGFGENLTVAGFDETSVCIADRFAIGQVVLEISQPRQPCWKINRRWGDSSLLKRVAQTGRTGWYARVIEQGRIDTSDTISLIHRPYPDWSIARANDILIGRLVDHAAQAELLLIPELSQAWKVSIS